MGTSFSTTLQCPSCNTRICYENEAPRWETSNIRSAELEEARKFAEEHHGEWVPRIYSDSTDPETKKLIRTYQPLAQYIEVEAEAWAPFKIVGVRAVDLRIIPCPACGAEVRPSHGISPATVDV